MAASVQIMYMYTYSTHASFFLGNMVYIVPICPHLIQILDKFNILEILISDYGFQDYRHPQSSARGGYTSNFIFELPIHNFSVSLTLTCSGPFTWHTSWTSSLDLSTIFIIKALFK